MNPRNSVQNQHKICIRSKTGVERTWTNGQHCCVWSKSRKWRTDLSLDLLSTLLIAVYCDTAAAANTQDTPPENDPTSHNHL